jgi:hypothetical protein
MTDTAIASIVGVYVVGLFGALPLGRFVYRNERAYQARFADGVHPRRWPYMLAPFAWPLGWALIPAALVVAGVVVLGDDQ